MIKIIKEAKTGTLWVVEGGEEVYQQEFLSRESFKKQ